jgi:hypothetical protein
VSALVIRPSVWVSVPLRSNDRMHHMAKARAVKGVRTTIAWELAAMRRDGALPAEPIDYPVTATLVWEVTDNRIRDVGASAPTLKACLDQCVADHVLLRDDRTVVVEERYRIEVGSRRGVRIELVAA